MLTAKTTLFMLLAAWLTSSVAWAQSWVLHERTGNLEFFSEVNLDVRQLASELSRVTSEVDTLLKLPPTLPHVQIVLFRSSANYRSYLSTRIPEALNRRAIFYKSGTKLLIYAVHHPQMMTDLRHEFTHALLHSVLPFVPLWIDEGLAEYFEETPRQRAKSSRFSAVKWKCRTGWSPNLRRLEKMGSASAMTGDDYRDSWAFVHFLLNDSIQTQQLFRDYLSVISAGGAPGTFSEWTTERAPTVTNRIGSYFRRIRFAIRSGSRP